MTGMFKSWQNALKNVITEPEELLHLLQLPLSLLPGAKKAVELFPLKVTHGFVARMQKGNVDDPLLRQVLPLGIEASDVAGFSQDPLQESAVNPLPGLLHKYHGRVLLTLTGSCSINCRFCFRRHFPYSDNNPGKAGWNETFEYIAKDPTISEIILSGGDPLIANDNILQDFSCKLVNFPQIKRLRIHSRVPIILPERITDTFLDWAMNLKQQLVLVVHCNHPQEINQEVAEAMQKLTKAGVILLNQSVLLKGVNDDSLTLIALSESLFSIGVKPYYLHLLDKVKGSAHFDVPLVKAKKLYDELMAALSGYLVPKLVYEEAGATSKINIF